MPFLIVLKHCRVFWHLISFQTRISVTQTVLPGSYFITSVWNELVFWVFFNAELLSVHCKMPICFGEAEVSIYCIDWTCLCAKNQHCPTLALFLDSCQSDCPLEIQSYVKATQMPEEQHDFISSVSFCCFCHSTRPTEIIVKSSPKFCTFSFCSCSERYWPLPGENHSFPPSGLSFSQLGAHQTGCCSPGGAAHTLQVTTQPDKI